MKSVKFFPLSLIFLFLPTVDLSACGPYIFSNQEMDPLSFIDPKMVDDSEYSEFFLYASAPLGLGFSNKTPAAASPIQTVIQNSRLDYSTYHLVNPIYDVGEGEAPTDVESANVSEWRAFFKTQFAKNLSPEECIQIVYDFTFPNWLDKPTLEYLNFLKNPNIAFESLIKKAEDPKTVSFLKTRWAFQAVKMASLDEANISGPETFKRLEKNMDPKALSTGRAFSYQAKQKPKLEALVDYLNIFDRFPPLRSQTFLSLMNAFGIENFDSLIQDKSKPATLRASASFARFLVLGRDFDYQTLRTMAGFEPNSPRTKMMFLKMIEIVEQEGGPKPLLNLTSGPDAKDPKGLYTKLIDEALTIASKSPDQDKAFWLTGAAYLCLYDGNLDRMEKLVGQAIGTTSPRIKAFRDRVQLMVDLGKNRGQNLTQSLETRFLGALEETRKHKNLGENRGAYHSLVVLLAQKYLERGQLDLASMAFGLINDQDPSNPYQLSGSDWFWSSEYPSNNPHNFLVDVLISPTDLQSWKTKVLKNDGGPLVRHLVSRSILNPDDLDYLTAYKYLRRGESPKAVPILKDLEKSGFFKGNEFLRNDKSILPVRTFAYSDQLSVWSPAQPDGLKKASLLELAQKLEAMEKMTLGQKDPKKLLEAAAFFVSLQVTGFPLIFSNPPQVISFVGDYELYPYVGTLEESPLDEYPLYQPQNIKSWKESAMKFHSKEFSPLKTAQGLLSRIIELKSSPDLEIQAIALLATFDTQGSDKWKKIAQGNRYASTVLYNQLQGTCEGF